MQENGKRVTVMRRESVGRRVRESGKLIVTISVAVTVSGKCCTFVCVCGGGYSPSIFQGERG